MDFMILYKYFLRTNTVYFFKHVSFLEIENNLFSILMRIEGAPRHHISNTTTNSPSIPGPE
jgi:hypothetical protein